MIPSPFAVLTRTGRARRPTAPPVEGRRAPDPSAPTREPSIRARPDGVGAVCRPGPSPYSVLMFGGGVLDGRGLRSHEAGLPGAVADRLTERSGRGVDITVIVEPDPMGARAREGLHGLRLLRFDLVIVVLGERAAVLAQSPAAWAADLHRVAALLESECADQAPAFIYDSARAVLSVTSGVRKKVAAAAAQHVDLGEEIAGGSALSFRELPPPQRAVGGGRRFSSVTYQDWADLIVQRLHLGLSDADVWAPPSTSRSFRSRPDDEDLRLRALRSAGIRDGERDAVLEFLVRQAKATFGVDGAALNIVDDDHQWPKATVGRHPGRVEREVGFGRITIESDGLTLIYDTHRDPRSSESPLAQGQHPLRFYAGYPIHTWDGYRIGALCIYDEHPRYMRETQLATLRTIAGRIEQHLWSAALRLDARWTRTMPPDGARTVPAGGTDES